MQEVRISARSQRYLGAISAPSRRFADCVFERVHHDCSGAGAARPAPAALPDAPVVSSDATIAVSRELFAGAMHANCLSAFSSSGSRTRYNAADADYAYAGFYTRSAEQSKSRGERGAPALVDGTPPVLRYNEGYSWNHFDRYVRHVIGLEWDATIANYKAGVSAGGSSGRQRCLLRGVIRCRAAATKPE